jgi:hypothetical protein
VARCVNQIQGIGVAVACRIRQADRLAFYRNASFSFDIHRIEQLVFEFAGSHQVAELDHPVGKGRFAVIDMGYYTEIADMIHICLGKNSWHEKLVTVRLGEERDFYHGNLEKLSFRPISSLRNKILTFEYRTHICGKIFVRATILNKNPNSSSSPKPEN